MIERVGVDPDELKILTTDEATPVSGSLPWEVNLGINETP